MTPVEWSESADPWPMLSTVLPGLSDRKQRLFGVACCRQVEGWLVRDCGYVLDLKILFEKYAGEFDDRFAVEDTTILTLSSVFWEGDKSASYDEQLEDLTIAKRVETRLGHEAGRIQGVSGLTNSEREGLTAHPSPDDSSEPCDRYDALSVGAGPSRELPGSDPVPAVILIGRRVLQIVRHYGGREREAQERASQAALVRDIFGDPFPPPAFDPAWRTPDVDALAADIYEDRGFDRMPILADALEEAGCSNLAIMGHCRGPGPHARGCWVLDTAVGKA